MTPIWRLIDTKQGDGHGNRQLTQIGGANQAWRASHVVRQLGPLLQEVPCGHAGDER